MADTKITALATITSLADADLFAFVDEVAVTPVSKSVRADDLRTYSLPIQAEIGTALYPQTAAETSAAVTPTNYQYPPGNVLRYGAAPDGTTNNSVALKAALDQAGGDSVVIPKTVAKWVIGTALSPIANTRIDCYGDIKSTTTPTISIDVDGVEWYGGTYEGNATTDTQVCFRLTDVDDCVVDVKEIFGFLNKAIVVSGTSDGNYVRSKEVRGSSGTTGVGISITGLLTTNTIVGPSYCNANRVGMSLNGCDGFSLISPNCSGNSSAGLMYDGIITFGNDGPRNGVVTNPVCNNNGSAESIYGGIYYGNGCHNIRTIGAVCNGNTGAGIRSSGGVGYESRNMAFIAPTCNYNGIDGISLSNSDTTTITAPDCRFNTGYGIRVFQSDRVEISGGNLSGNTAAGMYTQSDYTRMHDVMSIGNTHGIRHENGGSSGPNNRFYDNILIGPTDTFVDGDVTVGTDRITLTAHDFVLGDLVRLTTSGTLPAGLALATNYYVKTLADDADTIELYSDSLLTSIVDITAAAGGGTHTLTTANTTAALVDTPGTAYIRNNVGYVTENSGTGSIVSASTTDVITHGLAGTPAAADISITLTENPTNTPGAIWVDTIGATTFTVNCENDPGASNLDFSWKASI